MYATKRGSSIKSREMTGLVHILAHACTECVWKNTQEAHVTNGLWRRQLGGRRTKMRGRYFTFYMSESRNQFYRSLLETSNCQVEKKEFWTRSQGKSLRLRQSDLGLLTHSFCKQVPRSLPAARQTQGTWCCPREGTVSWGVMQQMPSYTQ